MKKTACTLFLLFHTLVADPWFDTLSQQQKEAQSRAENDSWFRDTLKKRLAETYDLAQIEQQQKLSSHTKPCRIFSLKNDAVSFYIFMTLSLPNSLWHDYSKPLQKIGGAFVLQGLPNDSFFDLAKKVKELRTQGVHAPIQLHPNLFTTYQVKEVPTLLLTQEDRYDKITGTLSLSYALTLFSQEGDTANKARFLLQALVPHHYPEHS